VHAHGGHDVNPASAGAGWWWTQTDHEH
jgi:hypothetical protein